MKTKELLESVGIKFNSNGFCVVTQTDVNRALKAYSAQQVKEIDRLTEELGYERSIQKEEYQIKINELREALTQALVKAGHQMHSDLLDRCRKLIG